MAAPPADILCCPEDVRACPGDRHPETRLCPRCRIPLCQRCYESLAALQPPPMALANDNFWGYTTDIIQRYRVRWMMSVV